MANRFYIVFLFLGFAISGSAQNAIFPYNGTIYDGAMHQIDILMPDDSVKALYDEKNRWTNNEYEATVIYDQKDTIRQVCIRIRGNTSRDSKRPSFKVSFDSYTNQTYQGLKTFNVNGEHNDPSLVRTIIGYKVLASNGNALPRSNSVRLFFNHQFVGIYVNIEEVDKIFLKSRFDNKNGNLYKCNWPSDLTWKGADQQLYKAQGNNPLKERIYDLKTNDSLDDYSDLVEFIRIINLSSNDSFPKQIERIFDVHSFLKSLAAEVLIGHWDSYFMNKNNYFLYHNSDNQLLTYISYDPDNTFGIAWGIDKIASRDIHNWGNKNWSSSPLVYRLFNYSQYKLEYERNIQILIRDVFNEKMLFPYIDTLKAHINPYIANDTYYNGSTKSDYGFTVGAWDSSFTSAWGAHVTYGIKPYIAERIKTAQQQYIKNSISEPENNTSLQLYPNPTKDILYIQFDSPQSDYQVELYDLFGRLVVHSNDASTLDLSSQSSGIYIIKVTSGSSVFTKKISVER
ncbi:MAG: CotH kinase family protein [Bacteroidetes bacterium]|nr:CotH kinase family protein [Bacteroidota bacterium]